MSEKSKGDTYTQQSQPQRVNPLLSASVTGLTFDEFPNKPLLLPAAPPVVHQPVNLPSPLAVPIGRGESKSLVTVGNSSDLDTESLDEINLNTTPEDGEPAQIDPNSNNQVWEQTVNSGADSILSQAASSFSALPSVASSVFSTFSKRIYSGSTSRERTPQGDYSSGAAPSDPNANPISQLDIQPAYIQHPQHQQPVQPSEPSAAPAPFYAPPPPSVGGGNYFEGRASTDRPAAPLPLPEPPKFYTPEEVPALPSVGAVPPPAAAASQNTYRLSAKKKLYAPIPGLSDQTQHNAGVLFDPSAVRGPIPTPAPYQPPGPDPYAYPAQQQPIPALYVPPQPQPSLYGQSQPQPTPPIYRPPSAEARDEGRGSGRGRFSLTSFVPSGVLQNLSGFVQSAAGTISGQSARPESASNQPHHYQGPSPFQPPSAGVAYEASIPPQLGQQPVPPLHLSYPGGTTNQQQLFSGPTPPLYVEPSPQLQPPPIANTPVPQPHLASFDPAALGRPAPVPVPPEHPTSAAAVSFFNPHFGQPAGNVTPIPPIHPFPPTVEGPQSAADASRANLTPISGAPVPPLYVDPSSGQSSVPGPLPPLYVAPSSEHSFVPGPLPPLYVAPSSEQSFVPGPVPPLYVAPSSEQSTVPRPLPPLYVAPSSEQSFVPGPLPPLYTGPSSGQTVPAQLPPTAPPPSGQTSFRLQKGTRLYKSPLTSAETVPAYGGQVTPQASGQLPPQGVFNPFAATAPSADLGFHPVRTPTPTPTSFFVPTVSLEPQSVPLFVPLQPESDGDQVSLGPITFDEAVEALQELSQSDSERVIPFAQEQTSSDEDIIDKVKTKEADSAPQADTSSEVGSSQSPREEDHAKAAASEILAKTIETVLADNPGPSATVAEAPEEKAQQESNDPLEKTLQLLLLKQEARPGGLAQYLPPPPHGASAPGHNNPYRKGLPSLHSGPATPPPQPSLANFFTPLPSGPAGDFNFFSVPPPAVPAGGLPSKPTPIQSAPLPDSTTFPAPDLVGSLPSTTPAQPALFPPLPDFGDQARQQPAVFESAGDTKPPSEDADAEPLPTVAPPLGFDNIVAEALAEPSRRGVSPPTPFANDLSGAEPKPNALTSVDLSSTVAVNSFSNFFHIDSKLPVQSQPETPKKAQPIPKLPDPTSFFDSFAVQPSPVRTAATAQAGQTPSAQSQQEQQQQLANEDQRIQNFFNNPPPQENGGVVGDLNYDLVHSGLGVKDLQRRSLTPASNLVEPPSSSCSEFSELNTSSSTSIVPKPASVLLAEKLNKSSTERVATSAPIGNALTLSVPVLPPTSTVAEDTPNTAKHYEELPEEILHELGMANLLTSERGAAAAPPATILYNPAVKHWFYKRPTGGKDVWMPFSHYDSALLETSLSMDAPSSNVVAVEGGRYEVNVRERTKIPVYWEGDLIEVRRCSWFYKGTDSKYVPYEEDTADLLEAEYKEAAENGVWHKKIILSMGEQVVFHGPTVIVHFQQQQSTDAWGGTSQTTTRPRVVKRDLDDFTILPGESQRVDHLLFMVHGIGSACDLKMRTVEEVVDEFRGIAQQLVQSHYKNSTDMGLVGRVEVLPISWHSHLHSEEMGIDVKLKSITLESIPKLRNFTNDTLLDVLFYTSPIYCQKIMNTVAASMNAVYLKYRERHPDFSGGISVAGHSLGSLILFDLLCHQNPIKECEEQNMENPDQQYAVPQSTSVADANRQNEEIAAKQISYTMGPAGTGQPFISYAQLIFQPKKFFALGSPIGMFVTIRGIDQLGLDFRLPTCPGFYNIFHPFDPVAYRVEALINADMKAIRPVLIPHHKGRKRMHLELKETMTRVTADLKQRFMDTFQTTLDSVNFLNRNKKESQDSMETEVGKVIEMQMQLEQQQQQLQHQNQQILSQPQGRDSLVENSSSAQFQQRPRSDSTSTTFSDQDMVDVDFPLGKLNDSKRVDYVLQEAPLEFFNEYLFALSSHVCYWDSEDTILFVMKEIYAGLGVSPDSQVPQQSMTIERPSSHGNLSKSNL